jgi:hypothetical protein
MRILDDSIRQEIDDTDDAGLDVAVTMSNEDPSFMERGSVVVTAETLTGELYKTDPHENTYI